MLLNQAQYQSEHHKQKGYPLGQLGQLGVPGLGLVLGQEGVHAAGTNMGAVVKTTVFLADMNDFAAMNEVYAQFFQEPFPARSAVQAARLPKDAKVEIEAIAQL